MASLAVSFALGSERVSAEIVEANEYPDLAQRYQVYGVPLTIVDDGAAIEGAVPEAKLLEAVLAAGGQPPVSRD